MANKRYIGVQVLNALTIPLPPGPSPPPPTSEPLALGRWVDVSRDGSTLAVGQSTYGFAGGAIEMRRGAYFGTVTTLTSTVGPVNEYGNVVATNADGSIVVCGALRDGASIDGYASVRHGTNWEDETVLEPAGSSIFLTYSGGKPVAISDDGTIIALTDGTKVFVCSGVDWGDVITLTPPTGAWCVAISGDGTVVAAGDSYNYVYVFSGTDYATMTTITPSDLAELEEFGWSVALSGDGSVLAVGNPSHGSNPPISYAETGAGYVYTGAGWATEQIFPDPPASDWGHQFGWATDVSADGSVVAFTAWGREPTGSVFRYSGAGYSVETETQRPGGGGVGTFAVDVALNEDGTIMGATEDSVWVFTF